MFGLQEIVAFNNGTPQPDANTVQLERQNSGLWCSKCGSTSGHYNFCPAINGGAYVSHE
jgi:hypothetical protein